jgi:hypothetical protein
MFLVKLWDKYDREIMIDLHRETDPVRPTLAKEAIVLFVEVLKTLLIGSGIFRKKEKKR